MGFALVELASLRLSAWLHFPPRVTPSVSAHQLISRSASFPTGGFTRESAPAHADRTGDVVVFGRHFSLSLDSLQRLCFTPSS